MSNGGPPSGGDESRFRGAANACVELWKGLRLPIDVPPENEIKFRVCFPLAAHALCNVWNALEILDQIPLVASGCVRVALECSVSAQWVRLTHQGEDRLIRAMEHNWRTRAGEFSAAVGDPVELEEIVAKGPIAGELRSWSMTEVFDRFSETRLFYDMYRDLSQAIHPSYGLLQAYISLDPGADASVDRAGRLKKLTANLQGLGLAAVLAMDTVERMRAGQPRLAEVAAIAARAGLPHDLSLSDQRPDLQGPPVGRV